MQGTCTLIAYCLCFFSALCCFPVLALSVAPATHSRTHLPITLPEQNSVDKAQQYASGFDKTSGRLYIGFVDPTSLSLFACICATVPALESCGPWLFVSNNISNSPVGYFFQPVMLVVPGRGVAFVGASYLGVSAALPTSDEGLTFVITCTSELTYCSPKRLVDNQASCLATTAPQAVVDPLDDSLVQIVCTSQYQYEATTFPRNGAIVQFYRCAIWDGDVRCLTSSDLGQFVAAHVTFGLDTVLATFIGSAVLPDGLVRIKLASF